MHWEDLPADLKDVHRGQKVVKYWMRNDDYEIQKVNWRKAKKLSRKFQAYVLPKMVLECC